MSESQTYKRDQVVGIINSVLGKIQTPLEVSQDVLSTELNALKATIENLRSQLHTHQASDIPNATDELDAVVGDTEAATNTIMESCEQVLEELKEVDAALFQKVEALVVKIFEACTFQDITGQRIRKVMACLKDIEGKTARVLDLIEGEEAGNDNQDGEEEQGDGGLLNGPALPANAVSQDDIDKLLAEFDDQNG